MLAFCLALLVAPVGDVPSPTRAAEAQPRVAAPATALDSPLATVHVRALEGRVGLASAGTVRWLIAGPSRPSTRSAASRTSSATVTGSGYLELGARSRAEVRVPGHGNLRVEGPAALEWRAGKDGDVLLDLSGFRAVDVEWRRGAARILVAGWRIEATKALLRLEQPAGGGCRLQHRGGAELRLQPEPGRGGQRSRRAPDRIRPGERIRLPRP